VQTFQALSSKHLDKKIFLEKFLGDGGQFGASRQPVVRDVSALVREE
jgi:hypothetical protein